VIEVKLKDLGELSDRFNLQMPKGMFLCTRDKERDNVMTIGWGFIGRRIAEPIEGRRTAALCHKPSKLRRKSLHWPA
jgi:lactate dehydrogenase-like 2-hydroxyacid dehydrogenase